MRTRAKIIAFSGALGLLVWVADAILDRTFFHQEPFWALLLGRASPHEIYMRSLILGVFLVFGLIVSAMVANGKRAQEALRRERDRAQKYLDIAEVIMVALNERAEVTLINKKGCAVLGYDESEILGRNWFRHFLPEPKRDETADVFGRLIAGDLAPLEYHENPVVTKSGEERTIAWHNALLRDESRRIIGTLSSGVDITDRTQAEQEIRRLNEELEQRVIERTAQLAAANEELEAFAYSVSHDLRAPLRAIDGFSEALAEDYGDRLDGEGSDCLQRVRRASQRMGELIDDLLELSRATSSEMRRGPVDLSALARDISEELAASGPERAVVFEIDDGLVAEADASLMRQALANLLGNAWKFTGTRPEARIEFRATEREGATAYFVRDNGVGFDMASADKLFGAFQRLHGASEFEGVGIGLATVRRIIHRHGGKVWAESAVDQGATFWFTLPGAGDEHGRAIHPAG